MTVEKALTSPKAVRQNSYNYWNARNCDMTYKEIVTDNWLTSYKSIIKGPVIDLGCGSGNNTKVLCDMGVEVIACDLSQNVIESIKRNFPAVKTSKFDLLDDFPFEENFAGAVVADLCLHYFTEAETLNIIENIKRVLKPGGYLYARVNSLKELHNPSIFKEVEKHLYKTEDDRYKRFFDKDDVNRLFSGLQICEVNEEQMLRYKEPKTVLKIIAQKAV